MLQTKHYFKKIAFVLLLSGLTYVLKAQTKSDSLSRPAISIGVKGGISIPNLSGGNNDISKGYKSRLGPNFGIVANFPFSKLFSIQPELQFAGEGGKKSGLQVVSFPGGGNNLLYANFKNVVRLNYLELPVLAKFTFGSTYKFFVEGGPYVGLVISAYEHSSGSSPIYADPQGQMQAVPTQDLNSSTNIKNQFKKFNVGATAGIGTEKDLGKGSIFLDARFEYGFVNIQKDAATNGKDQTGAVLVTLGYKLKLK